jgi:hypothetical protein
MRRKTTSCKMMPINAMATKATTKLNNQDPVASAIV